MQLLFPRPVTSHVSFARGCWSALVHLRVFYCYYLCIQPELSFTSFASFHVFVCHPMIMTALFLKLMNATGSSHLCVFLSSLFVYLPLCLSVNLIYAYMYMRGCIPASLSAWLCVSAFTCGRGLCRQWKRSLHAIHSSNPLPRLQWSQKLSSPLKPHVFHKKLGEKNHH